MNVLDIFCGAGGFSTGFDHAGYDILAGIDINDDALVTFEANHDAPGYNINLAETSPDTALAEAGVDVDEVDGIIGGPPCKAFSYLGERDSDDPRADLVRNYFDLIDAADPDFFAMENVRGILTMDGGTVIDDIRSRCAELGYDITMETMDAADYGVPQTRERVVIIGMQDHTPRHPVPTHAEQVSVADALGIDGEFQTSQPNETRQLRGDLGLRSLDEPAYTARCGTPPAILATGDEIGDVESITEVEHRRLTMDEMARIQSFPDGYEWHGNQTSRQVQIGNAVPPKLAEAIAEEIQQVMEGEMPTTGQTSLLDHGFALAD